MKHTKGRYIEGMLLDRMLTGEGGQIERQERLAQEEVTGGGDTNEVWISVEIKLPSTYRLSEEVVAKLPTSGPRLLESWGIVFLEEADGPVQKATLPEGWRLHPTEHAMWSRLVDPAGRVRASMFYKGAFYDRRSHLSISRRFSITLDYQDMEDHDNLARRFAVHDAEKFVDGKAVPQPLFQGAWFDDVLVRWGMPEHVAKQAKKKELEAAAEAWLEERYPDWADPAAYWEVA